LAEQAGRRSWYTCSNRDRVTGEHLCEAAISIRAEVLEEGIWEGMGALTTDLERMVREYRSQIVLEANVAELEQTRVLEKKLVSKMEEAIDKVLDADDPDEKRKYSERVADYKGQLKLLRRRISSFTSEVDAVEVATATITRTLKAALRTKVRSERRQILVDWVHEVRYTNGETEITLRVPLATVANCQRGEPAARPCGGAAAGVGDPLGTGRRMGPHRRGAADGERVSGRRRLRINAGLNRLWIGHAFQGSVHFLVSVHNLQSGITAGRL
jgi:hypothetical protein